MPGRAQGVGAGNVSAKKQQKEEQLDDGWGKGFGWIYAGSANMSMSAWGSISGSGASERIKISHYELGILLRGVRVADFAPSIPFQRPARRYDQERDEPLHFQQQQTLPQQLY